MDSKHLVAKDSKNQASQIESMADLPEELEREIKRLEKLFWVDTDKLKAITNRFIKELEDGLKEHNSNISMNVTWVMGWPTGQEKGTFLTLDLGGTNLRVCKIVLKGSGENILDQEQYHLPADLKTGSAEHLWEYVASSLEKFIKEKDWDGYDHENPIPLGFTFSYPCIQDYIDHGILQTWTKGFDISGVEGQDVAAELRSAMQARNLPVRLIALVNDTVGAMIASSYNDPQTVIGAIFGTGCNAAYMERVSNIPKLRDHPSNLSPDTQMAINCEYGAFDNAHKILPRTPYDETVDRDSPRPGEQTFEKLSAGLYLGEIFRLVLLDAHTRGILLTSTPNIADTKLTTPYAIDTALLSAIEDDESPHLHRTRDTLLETIGIHLTEPETEFCRRLAELIALRGSRLCACGIAAICLHSHIKQGHVAADGSVANKNPKFKKRWARAMAEVLGWRDHGAEEEEQGREEERGDVARSDPIRVTSAEDGSGVGAAVIVAMTLERAERGERVGIKEGVEQ